MRLAKGKTELGGFFGSICIPPGLERSPNTRGSRTRQAGCSLPRSIAPDFGSTLTLQSGDCAPANAIAKERIKVSFMAGGD